MPFFVPPFLPQRAFFKKYILYNIDEYSIYYYSRSVSFFAKKYMIRRDRHSLRTLHRQLESLLVFIFLFLVLVLKCKRKKNLCILSINLFL